MTRFQVRLDPEIHAWLEELARREDRSINQQINHMLRRLKQEQERGADRSDAPS